jgi:hypothetical protein
MTRATILLVSAMTAAVLTVATAPAVGAPSISMKVVGFAAIFDNDAHVVRAKNGGVLKRCDDPRAFAVVLDVANVKAGLPYQVLWTVDGKPVYTGKKGTSGAFDAKPDRIELSFRKASALPNGVYVFRMVLGGVTRAKGTVTRTCA